MATLAQLAGGVGQGTIVLATVNAALQRVPPQALVVAQSLVLAPGQVRSMRDIVYWAETNGFSRASTVRDVGEYAVRGGILDLYAPGTEEPVRLDFFGEELETIRSFDPESQRVRPVDESVTADLSPIGFVLYASLPDTVDTATMRRFAFARAAGNVRSLIMASAVATVNGFNVEPGS